MHLETAGQLDPEVDRLEERVGLWAAATAAGTVSRTRPDGSPWIAMGYRQQLFAVDGSGRGTWSAGSGPNGLGGVKRWPES